MVPRTNVDLLPRISPTKINRRNHRNPMWLRRVLPSTVYGSLICTDTPVASYDRRDSTSTVFTSLSVDYLHVWSRKEPTNLVQSPRKPFRGDKPFFLPVSTPDYYGKFRSTYLGDPTGHTTPTVSRSEDSPRRMNPERTSVNGFFPYRWDRSMEGVYHLVDLFVKPVDGFWRE